MVMSTRRNLVEEAGFRIEEASSIKKKGDSLEWGGREVLSF
jgi:hypothetical protein